MPETPDPFLRIRYKPNTNVVVVIISALLVAYPLSLGPAARLADKGVISWYVFGTVYDPLIVVGTHVPVLGEAMSRYVFFCDPDFMRD